MKKIYLDHAATTPVDKKVLKAMLPYFSRVFGNAMSLHSFGQEAVKATEKARRQTADFFGCDSDEIVFTSGATEANNLAVKGVVKAYCNAWTSDVQERAKTPGGHRMSPLTKPHIITTIFEHHCVLDACKSLEKEKVAEVTYIKPGSDGVIKIEDVEKAIRKNTILVSIMYVNNEIGTVQPIAAIGKMIKARNAKHSMFHVPRLTTLFHTDATQAVNYFECDVDKLGVDLLSMSAHKIYGPKGIGILYIKKNTPIARVQDGGDQENKKRAGTHNVPGIVGLGAALAEVQSEKLKVYPVKSSRSEDAKGVFNRVKELRNYLIKRVLKEIPDTKLNGSKTKRSPNNANFSFANVEGESLLLMLDAEGIAASTGSACSSGSLQPSHVLLSLGIKPEQAHGSLRVTIGKYITKKEIDIFINKLKEIIEQLRKVAGNVLNDYYAK
ncbi:MAG: hypothetical protein A2288_01330 [Candidatus Moranbacteria bacterium RIFOXYA12_FULL_44_15]|nr:MAG: hypothetical protein A2288_01330 [Candidatus Moranbacteria bacterium RIFOXYA12_FULL_44_15]OGI36196.1 MAG: hypothetical protein A2259_03160 [Candidatus Moranbacteria bacterium RIFOXYA2_FULL_43_15]